MLFTPAGTAFPVTATAIGRLVPIGARLAVQGRAVLRGLRAFLLLALLLRSGIAIGRRLILQSGAIGRCLVAFLLGGLSAAILALQGGIAVRHIAAMLRIVVPVAVAIAVQIARVAVRGVSEVVVGGVVDGH